MNDARSTLCRVAGAVAALLVVAVLVACQTEASEPETPRPNIVPIFSDELAPEFLGAHGGTFPSRNLDRPAGESTK